MDEPGGGRPGTDPHAGTDDDVNLNGDGAADRPADDASAAVGEETVAASAEDTATAEDKPKAPPPPPRRRRRRSFWRELPILIAVALLLAVLIKTFALQAFFIPSGSMENTLEINDRVLINKLVYDFRGIHRGDIVVFDGDGSWYPGSVPSNSNPFSEFFSNLTSMFGFGGSDVILVKRVIGLPGDRVACCDAQGRVTVNGVPLTEQSYLFPGDVPSLVRFNVVVPANHLWVMGDHRSVSDDSRGHLGDPGGGTVPQSAVLGRAFIIIWPPSRWRILPIPSTFQQPALDKKAAAGAEPDLLDARLRPAGPALPLALGFAGAVPVTVLQRRARVVWRRRRESR
ncbi:MAG TPA: signal peptidase I [Streptosporangiaceae bacterium]|nr:signal peptidase I [Streptosporangiaceae bacterium]